jgi:hypothetical protein
MNAWKSINEMFVIAMVWDAVEDLLESTRTSLTTRNLLILFWLAGGLMNKWIGGFSVVVKFFCGGV